MKSVLFSALTACFKWAANLILLVPSAIRVHAPFVKKTANVTTYAGKASRDFAIVATFAPGGLSIFIRNLIAGFAENQVNVVLVSNCPLSSFDRDRVSGLISVLIERDNLGRDFGAYQAGVRYLEEAGALASCRKLFLVNDSAFYTKTVGRLIADILGMDKPFIGLFESFEHHYHVGSFFLCFSQEVVTGEIFRSFWRRYKPYSTRFHGIFAGEAELTKQLMAGNIMPFIVYSTSVVRTALLESRTAEQSAFGAQIAPCIPESWVDPTPRQAGNPPLRLPINLPAGLGDADLELLDAFIRACERANQSHALALCANRLMRAPLIKRDLCYRGFWSIASLVHLVDGFTEEERGEMLGMLRRKSVPQAFSGLQRLRLIIDA
jgi:hypothetical protein